MRTVCSAIAAAAAVVCAIAGPAAAQTTINGRTISADETWKAAGNPYAIHGDIVVAEGATRTIEAGTQMKIARLDVAAEPGGSGFVRFHIKGSLVVNGTPVSPVSFFMDPALTAQGYC